MTGLSTYLQAKTLAWLLRNTQLPTPPATVYVSLHSADPGQTGANELAAGTYARASFSTGASGAGTGSAFAAPTASGTTQQSANTAQITNFPAVGSVGWGTATHAGVWDAPSGGNYLGGGALGSSQVIAANSAAPFFDVSSLTLSMQ